MCWVRRPSPPRRSSTARSSSGPKATSGGSGSRRSSHWRGAAGLREGVRLSTHMLRAFIFDIGNVILRFDFQHAIRKLEQHCDPVAESVLELIEPVKLAYEDGRMERAAFQEQVRAILRYTGSDADMVAAWEDIFTANEPMVRLIEELAPRFPLYLLSNTSDIHVDFIFRRFPVFERFQDAVYSYKVRASKPSRAIYEIAARQFAVEPGE